MLQAIWAKTNPRERQAVIGAGLILLAWLVGIVLSGGYFGIAGSDSLALLGAIAVLVVVYLRYSPTSNVSWPAPYPLILFAISAVVGVVALLQLISVLGWIGLLADFGGILVRLLIPLALYFAGAALMVWGSYQEWQATRTTTA